jgi:hypothetical protein
MEMLKEKMKEGLFEHVLSMPEPATFFQGPGDPETCEGSGACCRSDLGPVLSSNPEQLVTGLET